MWLKLMFKLTIVINGDAVTAGYECEGCDVISAI